MQQAHDNLNFESEFCDVELDLAWFDKVSKSNNFDYFCDDVETIDVSDSLVAIRSDKSVNLPGHLLFSEIVNTDKNNAAVDTNSFFVNMNINDVS